MKALKRILLVLAGLVLLAIACDWLLGVAIQFRTTRGAPKGDRMGLRIHPAPYTMSELRADPSIKDPICVINEQGFRHPTLVTREKNRPRVFILGGSFAFGAGGSPEDKYYLAYVRAAFPSVEFINAAGSSFVARQEWIQLALNVLPLRPDAVVIVDGFNDLALPMAFGQAPGAPWQWHEYEQILSGRLAGILRGYVESRSQIYRLYSRLRLTRRASSDAFSEDIFPRICEQYAEATQVTYDLCRSRGIKAYHVFQPQLAVDKTPSPEESNMSLPALSEAMRQLYPRLASVAQECASSNEVPFTSLLGIFSNVTDQIYVDYCHVNDRGQEMTGEAIADFLRASGLADALAAPAQR